MPTYQYVCTNADGKHEFEMVQSFSDAPVSECPVCGSPVRKVYGSVGVVFKGSGFYRTDSRVKAESSPSSSSSSSGDGGSGGNGAKPSTPAKEGAAASSSGSASKSPKSSSSSSGGSTTAG